MAGETLEKQIRQLVASVLERNADDIAADQDLTELPEFDSMRSVLILAKIEEAFGLLIPEDDIFDITSISDWVAEIEKLRS
ncbi:MAG: acyl carrier protein [Akkermansia sp.]